jgi:hypothetical protein
MGRGGEPTGMKPSDDPENWDREVLEHLGDDVLRQDDAARTGIQLVHDHALSMFRICFVVIGFPVTAVGLFGADFLSVVGGETTCLTTPLSVCVSLQATVVSAFVLLFVGMVLFLVTAGITSSVFFRSLSGPTPRLYLLRDDKEYLVDYVSDYVTTIERRDGFPFVLYGLLYTGFACVLAALLLVSGAGYVVLFGEQLPAAVGVAMVLVLATPFLALLLFVSERRRRRWVRWIQRRAGHRPAPTTRTPRPPDSADRPGDEVGAPTEER